jgi:hypothetical protein
MDKALSNIEVDLNRFIIIRDAHEYKTVDYEAAANRVDLRITMAVGSVKVL